MPAGIAVAVLTPVFSSSVKQECQRHLNISSCILTYYLRAILNNSEREMSTHPHPLLRKNSHVKVSAATYPLCHSTPPSPLQQVQRHLLLNHQAAAVAGTIQC